VKEEDNWLVRKRKHREGAQEEIHNLHNLKTEEMEFIRVNRKGDQVMDV
jgi:hypothetical protein